MQVLVSVRPNFDKPAHESLVKGNKDQSHEALLVYERRIGLIRSVRVPCQQPTSLLFNLGSNSC